MKTENILLLWTLAGMLAAGEILVCDKASEGKATFTSNHYKYMPEIKEADGQKFYRVKGRVSLVSDSAFKIDPEKYYVTSVRIRAGGANATRALLGIAPVDAQNRIIDFVNITIVPKTFTELARPCRKNDTSIVIKDGVNWSKGVFSPAFEVKKDESDLPCFTVAENIRVLSVAENDENFTVKLSGPVGKDYPAGTPVRLHRHGGAFIYEVNQTIGPEWTTWKGKPRKGSNFRKTAVGGRPVLICNNGFPEESLDFNELTVEEVPAP